MDGRTSELVELRGGQIAVRLTIRSNGALQHASFAAAMEGDPRRLVPKLHSERWMTLCSRPEKVQVDYFRL